MHLHLGPHLGQDALVGEYCEVGYGGAGDVVSAGVGQVCDDGTFMFELLQDARRLGVAGFLW